MHIHSYPSVAKSTMFPTYQNVASTAISQSHEPLESIFPTQRAIFAFVLIPQSTRQELKLLLNYHHGTPQVKAGKKQSQRMVYSVLFFHISNSGGWSQFLGRQKCVKNFRTHGNLFQKQIKITAVKHDRRAWTSSLFQEDSSTGVKKRQKPSCKGEGQAVRLVQNPPQLNLMKYTSALGLNSKETFGFKAQRQPVLRKLSLDL